MKKIINKTVFLFTSLTFFASIFGIFTVSTSAETCQIELRKNSKVAYACEKGYRLDVAAFEEDGLFYVPVRFFFERFGFEFAWDNANKTAAIASQFFANKISVTAWKNVATIDSSEVKLRSQTKIKSGRLFMASGDLDSITKPIGIQSGFKVKSGALTVDIDKTKIKYKWNDFTRPILGSDGKNLTFSKVLAEPDTKVVIVQIWHTACAGCVDVLKLFEKLWTKYEGKGLKIVSINTDGVGFEASRDERIENTGITYQICSDPEYLLKPEWYDPIFPNYYMIVPGEKYIRIFQERWDTNANEAFESAVDSLCSGN